MDDLVRFDFFFFFLWELLLLLNPLHATFDAGGFFTDAEEAATFDAGGFFMDAEEAALSMDDLVRFDFFFFFFLSNIGPNMLTI